MHRLLLVEVANWKVVGLFAAVTVALLVAGVVRRSSWIAVMVGLLVTGALTGADAVNTYYGYLPQVADVVGVAEWPAVPLRDVISVGTGSEPAADPVVRREGGVLSLPVRGVRSGFGHHTILVYLPPAYFARPNDRFPVVYLLHGSPGRPEDWLRAGQLERLVRADAPAAHIIFVMPPVSRGWLDDSECVDGRREHVETWVVNDVVPRVDSVLRTLPDRAHRALVGMSAGGYCALNLALRHSAVFGSALDMSGYTRPTYDGGLRALFGHDWRAAAAENTPATYLAHHAVTLPLRLRFDIGREDPVPLREVRALLPVLRARHVDATLHTRTGSHTYHVWVPALRDGLRWLAGTLAPTARVAPAHDGAQGGTPRQARDAAGPPGERGAASARPRGRALDGRRCSRPSRVTEG